MRDRIKRFKRALARYGLHGSTWLLTHLPYPVVRGVTGFFIAAGFALTVRQKRIARETLDIAFGDSRDGDEKKEIMRRCFTNLGKGMIELIYFMAHPRLIDGRVVFEGKEHLDDALARGKGVIGVSAHFGNFPLMLLRLARAGYDTSAIIRRTRDARVEEYFQGLRERLGLNTIYSHPRKDCVDQSLRSLRRNGFLFIPLDQNFGSGGGVFVDFFGQKAATATGPVVFALRAGAPILPVFTIRQPDDTHKIIIEPPMDLDVREDDKETIHVNTARITGLIEEYIRRYPQEWGWMHRRWKSRPARTGGEGRENPPGEREGRTRAQSGQ